MYVVYIAAPFAARDGLRPFAQELRDIGMVCSSSWLNSTCDVETGAGSAIGLADDAVAKDCTDDLGAIDRSNAIVQFTGLAVEELHIAGASGPMLHSGGRHIELGYAIAKRKKLVVVGDPENIFQRSLATVVPDWHAAVLALVALERAANLPEAV